ncbi:transporter [Tsukamurella pulmonis]|uniref:Amino acid/polyamine/organocation transporter, APC superfamily n=1 Tax=Tsukamurella pulmonis TaxID=47312 RepID=A0A1H1F8D0_9ACTN|nr:APC family permease [Tsukamurella pulmonis]KXO88666.1 transporter [Tsukamurella pulmonis]KXP09301.1 transporter [Tsukamurella pulmonis]SDQ97157.1 amino acid/polyamine/organocation transporter, APC superfamily [Tsukamurella pulmonis]SUP19916.1 Serine/threonine exchanger SteT [Tsukamurella pulmonis]
MSGTPQLRRSLGLTDAVTVGLSAMVGAGVFVVFGPAAAAAGSALLVGLALAGVLAYCNASSSARLAARYPQSGGTYVYGRERLGPFWGHLAGWSFVVGKSASCAAMALTVGRYAWPAHAHAVAAGTVVALTALSVAGVERSARVARVVVAVVLAVLTVVVVALFTSGAADSGRVLDGAAGGPWGVLQAAGLLFFAFAGYARIATLGEEVHDPARTLPRAILLALGITLVVYAVIGVALLAVLGPAGLADSAAPIADAARAAGFPVLIVTVTACVAAVGALLALLLGVSRTTLAMARDGHLPRPLAAVDERRRVPVYAELAVGAVVTVVAATADLGAAIGFSSFAVLVYYAVANASAWTLEPSVRTRIVPGFGLIGCLAVALSLPAGSVAAGIVVLVVGALAYAITRANNRSDTAP